MVRVKQKGQMKFLKFLFYFNRFINGNPISYST